jgi:hypothetical protein
MFKHGLIQDAAAESILRRRRRDLHGQIAELMIAEPDTAEPEVVARHLENARNYLDSAQWWLRAGRQSIMRGAMAEASRHFHSGLDVLAQHPAGEARVRAEVALLSGLGPTLMVMHGPGSAAFGAIQRRAFAAMSSLEDKPDQFPITYSLALHFWGRAEIAEAARCANDLRAVAAAQPTDERIMAANTMAAMAAFHQGRCTESRDLLRESTRLYDPAIHAPLYPRYMMDFGVIGRFYLALAEHMTGDPDRALQLAHEAADLAQRLGQPHSVGFAMLARFTVHALRREFSESLAWARTCEAFAREQGFDFVGFAMVFRGWAESELGDPRQGLETLTTGFALWRGTGFENWQSWFGALHAEILITLGLTTDAVAVIDDQLARIARTGERVFEGLLVDARHRAVAGLPSGGAAGRGNVGTL